MYALFKGNIRGQKLLGFSVFQQFYARHRDVGCVIRLPVRRHVCVFSRRKNGQSLTPGLIKPAAYVTGGDPLVPTRPDVAESLLTAKNPLNILHTALRTVVHLFRLQMNSPELYYVVCSPVIPLRFVARWLSNSQATMLLLSFLF